MSRARKRSGGSFFRRLARDRPDHVERACRLRQANSPRTVCWSSSVPDVTNFKAARDLAALAWIDAQAPFERRQGAAGEDIEDGEPRRQWSLEPVAQPQATRRLLYLGAMATITARRRKPAGDDWRRAESAPPARWDDAAQAREAGRHRAGQSYGADGLGSAQDRRGLSGFARLRE